MTDEAAYFTDDLAERAVLGSLLIGLPTAVESDVLALVDGDMFTGKHQAVWESIAKIHAEHGRVEEILVAADLIQRAEMNRAGGGAYLHGLTTGVNPGSATYFARKVAEAAQRRALYVLGTRAAQMAGKSDQDLFDALHRTREDLELVELLAGATRSGTSGIVEGFGWLDSPIVHRPWLVPGLLRSSDRVMVTGTPGAGKSTLLRQIGALICMGLHPFTRESIEPRRLLVFDCENDEDENHAFFTQITTLAEKDGGERRPGYFHIRHKAGGLALGNRDHARLLLDAVMESRCDLAIIGPLYKLSAGNPNDEENARKITWVIDSIRERTGTAVLLEAHPGHKEVTVKDHAGQSHTRVDPRPRGSSLLLGWPEVGIGLQAGLDDTDAMEHRFNLIDWRGMRGARSWPTQVVAGPRYPWDASGYGTWGRHWVPADVTDRYEVAS